MNLLAFPLGGWKLYTDDLGYFQTNIKTAIEAYLSRFTAVRSNFVYSGCQIVFDSLNNEINCSEGWVIVNGELLECEAHSVSPPTLETTYTWVLEETDDPAGAKINDDGNTIQAYKKRRAILQEIASPDNSTDSYVSFEDALNRLWRIGDIEHGRNISMPMQAGWSFSSPLYYRKNIDGMVTIDGATAGASTSTGSIMAELPIGYRPESDVFGLYTTGSKLYPCIIRDWGAVYVNFGSDPRSEGRFVVPSYKGV